MKLPAHRARRASHVSWATFLTVLLLFVAMAVTSGQSVSERESHREVAARWQARQIAKGAARPPVVDRGEWREAPWARSLVRWDHAAFRAINTGWSNPVFDRAMPLITFLGDGLVQGLMLAGFFAWAMLRRREEWQRTALMGFAGVLFGLAAPLMKSVLPRFRPPSVYPYDVVLLVHPLYGGSFPSGHTLTAFCIATILTRCHRWTAPWAFGLATLVGLSRICVGVHWPLDVLGGAAFGIASGWLVTSVWATRMRSAARVPVTHMPVEPEPLADAA